MRRSRLASFLALTFVLAAAPARAEAPTAIPPAGQIVDIAIGGARHLRVGAPIARVSSASKDLIDVAAFPPDDLLITAKAIGRTQVLVWMRNGEVVTINVRVGPPAEAINERLRQLFPAANVRTDVTGATLTLSGEVSDANTAAEIERVVQAEIGGAGDSHVINLIRVIGNQQVQLEVRFAEVSRSALRQIGVNLWTRTGDGAKNIAGGITSPGTTGVATDPGNANLTLPNGLSNIAGPISGAFNFLVASSANSIIPLSGALSLLAEKGFAKTLAEPTLVAMSGQEAAFLAGGEFPIPIPQSLGSVIITYKKFGIQVHFVPTVLADDTIHLKLDTVVSDIDFSIGIPLGTVKVPGLTQREASTTVRLRDGQTFAIAGLISDKLRSTVDKVPLLGDIPVLGALFRSSSFRRDESELLIVITAHLVNPLAKGARIQMPGDDEVSDPNDFDFYLMGKGEAHKKAAGNVGYLR